jgi:hypothetical protein
LRNKEIQYVALVMFPAVLYFDQGPPAADLLEAYVGSIAILLIFIIVREKILFSMMIEN